MIMNSFDVVVVGAGPAGAMAALEAARLGFKSVLLLDKATFPRQKPCGGGISPKARKILKEHGLWDRVEKEAYPIRGLRLVSPNGKEVTLTGADTASVLNRSRFDQILIEFAEHAGAMFKEKTKVDSILEENGHVIGVKCGSEQIKARWVIAANGVHTRFNRDPRPKRLLHSCMAWFDQVPFEPNILEMVYDPELLPHYGWLFPESQTRVNIGICMEADLLGDRSIRNVFAGFLDRHFAQRLSHATQIGKWKGHPICPIASVEHNAPPGLLLVGEANRLVNVATAEGISYAMMSGVLAVGAIRIGEQIGMNTDQVAKFYTSNLRRSMERRLKAANLFSKIGIKTLNGMTTLGNSALVRRLTGEALARI